MSRFRPSLNPAPRPPQEAQPVAPVPSAKSTIPIPASARASSLNLARRELIETPPERVGFWLLILFLFHSSSRIFDSYLIGFHIPLILSIGCLICLVLTGRLFTGITSKVGTALTMYSVFLVLSIPGSIWRGGSFALVTEQWVKSFMAFVLAAGLISTMRHAVKAIRVQSYGLLVAALLAKFQGVEIMGRLSMPSGYYEGANELAAAMVLGAVYWWFNTSNVAHHKLWRLFSIFALVPILYVMSRTGSRAAMVSLLCILPFIFFRYSASGRMVFAMLVLAGGLTIFAIAPAVLTNRLVTFFNPSGEITSTEQATQVTATTGSTRQRLYLLIQSLKLTALHPIFGVGAGNFAVAENGIAVNAGLARGSWLGTHNTFTQISSEAGIPALIAFLCCFWLARKELLAIESTHRPRSDMAGREIVATAFTLRLALYAFFAFFPFEHIAYDHAMPTFLGIITGFSRASRLHVNEAISAGRRTKQFSRAAGPMPAPSV